MYENDGITNGKITGEYSTEPEVLVVDDQEILRDLFVEFFTIKGISNISCASDGFEAIEIIDHMSDEADIIVIMDYWMPGMDGLETIEHICERKQNAHFILISADESVRSKIKTTHVDRFFRKPLDLNCLVSYIRSHYVEGELDPIRSPDASSERIIPETSLP